jgi:hypothetical protein
VKRGAKQVAHALAPHRGRLIADSVAFNAATTAFLQSAARSPTPSLAASPAVLRALGRYRQDVGRARRSVAAVAHGTPARDLALASLRALESALGELSNGLSTADPKQAAAASARADKHHAEHDRLAKALERRLA